MGKLLIYPLLMLINGSVMAQDDAIDLALDKWLRGTVPVIATQQLFQALAEDPEIILLDSRERQEYEVSHLPGAKWVGYEDFSLGQLAGIHKDSKLVVYCSIGVRSEKIAEQLLSAGYSNVHNLYGGIFAWANERKILLDQQQQMTINVHGYNGKWAKLLQDHVQSPQAK
jgi:rhodanese-related sulfurtransferase